MGASDAPGPDAERRKPVRRSARGADRRGSRRRRKPRRSVRSGDGSAATGGCCARSRRWRAVSPFDPS